VEQENEGTGRKRERKGMGGEQAAGVLSQVKVDQTAKKGKKLSPSDIKKIKDPILKQYEMEGNPYFSTARLWDDGIILPQNTREVLRFAISTSLNAPIPDTTFGVFRM